MITWLITIPVLLAVCIALLGCLHTRRLLSRFTAHLERTRDQLEESFHSRRNLVPSVIALGAGVPGLGCEYLETLDNAAELVIRSKGFAERMVAENRLSSTLRCLRNGLEGESVALPPDLAALVVELNERETGIAVSAELYNRQVRAMIDFFRKKPYLWLGPLCGYREPYSVDVRLSKQDEQPAGLPNGLPNAEKTCRKD